MARRYRLSPWVRASTPALPCIHVGSPCPGRTSVLWKLVLCRHMEGRGQHACQKFQSLTFEPVSSSTADPAHPVVTLTMRQLACDYLLYHSCCGMQAGKVERAVEDAVRQGIRHIDTGVGAVSPKLVHKRLGVILINPLNESYRAQHVQIYRMTCARGRRYVNQVGKGLLTPFCTAEKCNGLITLTAF